MGPDNTGVRRVLTDGTKDVLHQRQGHDNELPRARPVPGSAVRGSRGFAVPRSGRSRWRPAPRHGRSSITSNRSARRADPVLQQRVRKLGGRPGPIARRSREWGDRRMVTTMSVTGATRPCSTHANGSRLSPVARRSVDTRSVSPPSPAASSSTTAPTDASTRRRTRGRVPLCAAVTGVSASSCCRLPRRHCERRPSPRGACAGRRRASGLRPGVIDRAAGRSTRTCPGSQTAVAVACSRTWMLHCSGARFRNSCWCSCWWTGASPAWWMGIAVRGATVRR